ncbi:hypothetical protein PoB_003167200 [Plakobranchus ocellatus]|uniref:HAT C-terminal dimerisation domain-containing protein n=1 Tax=Plakobranchus ocellatus TaxID=259542 RepID=A0AAV4AD24_9GAST|nr:hypothetical protein PoB_003167200 [Plakobranchus ocellatus]
MVTCLEPTEAISPSRSLQSLTKLATKFPRLIPPEELDQLDDEWRAILYSRDKLQSCVNKTPVEFWISVGKITDGFGELKFTVVSKLMKALLVLPHSSACVERVFSEVNLVKTPTTNGPTVANRLLARQHLRRNEKNCHTWTPSKELLNSVQSGQCHSRYTTRLCQKATENVVTFYDVLDGTN